MITKQLSTIYLFSSISDLLSLFFITERKKERERDSRSPTITLGRFIYISFEEGIIKFSPISFSSYIGSQEGIEAIREPRGEEHV